MLWNLFVACSFFEEPKPSPNIVLIITDTLRADHVGVYGAQNPVTPELDKLAIQGQFFSRAYAHSGWTLPSTTSLFTGLYPIRHRVGRSPTSRKIWLLTARADDFSELSRRDYQTAAVINNTFLAPTFGLNQGFDDIFIRALIIW